MMTDAESAGHGNAISGGFFYGPVLQKRDIQASIQLPAPTPAVLAQLPPRPPSNGSPMPSVMRRQCCGVRAG